MALLTATVSDSLGLQTPAESRVLWINRLLPGDSLGGSDSVKRAVAVLRQVSDLLGVADAVTVGGIARQLSVSVSDSLGASDAVARKGTALRLVSDAMGLSDLVALHQTPGGTLTVLVSDSLGLRTVGLGPTAEVALHLVADSLGASDAARRAVGYGRLVSSVMGLLDAVATTALVLPVADFTGTPLAGLNPLSVAFTDLSANAPTSWHWEKNDGSGWVDFAGTPTAENPTEVFAAGTWAVRLTATNAAGSDTKTRSNYVASTDPPAAGNSHLLYMGAT